jgi:hypothetical protein
MPVAGMDLNQQTPSPPPYPHHRICWGPSGPALYLNDANKAPRRSETMKDPKILNISRLLHTHIMPSIPSLPPRNWSRLARFVAKEDGKVHYGQPIDDEVDVGANVAAAKPCEMYEIKGSNPPFDGHVDKSCKLTISEVSRRRHGPPSPLPTPSQPTSYSRLSNQFLAPSDAWARTSASTSQKPV